MITELDYRFEQQTLDVRPEIFIWGSEIPSHNYNLDVNITLFTSGKLEFMITPI